MNEENNDKKIEESPQIPGPQEVQRELEEAMRAKFGDKVKIVSQQLKPGQIPSFPAEDDSENEKHEEFDLDFDMLPKDIVKHLDNFVINQNEAKKALSIAVCDHYNHVKKCHESLKENNDLLRAEFNYSKQNILILGPTGVGKTYLVKNIAKLIGVPFVKADATRFTQAGYVGGNVDDMVRDLVSQANGNIELAQYGIIYLDEVDKIAGSSQQSSGMDVSGRGGQNALLKLMEETEIDLRSSSDMIGQFQALMDLQRTGKVKKKLINTKHILFIISGAFSGLEDIIQKRLKVKAIGFDKQAKVSKEKEVNYFDELRTSDLVSFGFEPEFVGRLPIRVSCLSLEVKDLFEILSCAKGSILDQYIESFSSYGIKVKFQKSALRKIAELAYEEKTGARALMTVFEKVFRDYKYELPSTGISSFVVTKSIIEHPKRELKKLIKEQVVSGSIK